ncbi:MAG: response regulator [Verrucomicrobia subdivision 3 bacterium]|nr:response regulator [Limisphaerales bacterium]
MKEFLTVLIEDDEDDVFFFQRAMQQVDWPGAIQILRDGAEAIAYLTDAHSATDRQQHPTPSLVILDLNLPIRTGLDVLEVFRGHDDTTPVVVLTSSTSELDVRDAYRLGANCYFNKPSHPDGLVELLKVLKAHWLDYNRLA